uniref:hypothetical protein n=1 Tax=Rhodopirellula europaea TaxID=1263866 RepID=UPI0030ED4D80
AVYPIRPVSPTLIDRALLIYHSGTTVEFSTSALAGAIHSRFSSRGESYEEDAQKRFYIG